MLKCQICNATYPDVFRLKCDCGGILDVIHEFEEPFESLLKKEHVDIRRYLNLLAMKEEFAPSLTPPITPITERTFKWVRVAFKLEYLMPSGSFKDRGTYVTIAKLKEEGIKEVSLDSSGNAAISLALFGRSEGIKVHVFIPKSTSEGKKKLLRLLKAEIHEVDGSRMEAHERAKEFREGVYVSHWYNPYFLDGTKTFAYEAFEEGGEFDYAIIPAGSGTLLLGAHKGFRELQRLGKLKRIPKLIAVQAEGFESLMERGNEKNTLAEGIAIPEPPRKVQMKRAIRETRGTVVSVNERETRDAWEELLSMGFLVESTSAVAFAAFKKLLKKGFFEEEARVLMPLTGSGFKNVDIMMKIFS
ncbi:threonine synthase [Thermococcus sp. P6]|uniref:pyridoxal-phosphate dependent enzyme n=1 Tax=Thermococcus sp. P6 TaxID=122420 RepID=UPI000B59A8D7|nr:pyridoxal-phosphate dependent enzyme [Thermococcus sp. P6]ASJ10335.1 threonine synthase [Thermococcus sp. P6]